ncbi:hypothetical protein OESDEN_17108 [Oesophagostomum dentatum]|uniref:Uncharacterized protein n=1 Tax=Oesophagostomum dentatum TaxID=61180 RepID=A0A0B1SH45_OESDE|nr:hypothetical protein OESDEN_17108 [Oesophagostomum dentatum]
MLKRVYIVVLRLLHLSIQRVPLGLCNNDRMLLTETGLTWNRSYHCYRRRKISFYRNKCCV